MEMEIERIEHVEGHVVVSTSRLNLTPMKIDWKMHVGKLKSFEFLSNSTRINSNYAQTKSSRPFY